MLKFTFIVPNTRYKNDYLWSSLPSRGLLSLAAVLKRCGYAVDYIDADMDALSHAEVVARIRDFGSNAVGITMNTFQVKAAQDLAGAIKRYNGDITVIVGGPHPSSFKGNVLRACPWLDIASVSESEGTIEEIARAIDGNGDFSEIKGICYRRDGDVHETEPRPLIEDLDTVPFPAYELAGDLTRYPGALPVLNSPSMHMMASRGCPFNCIFCTKSVWGNKMRFRSPQNTVDEVEHLHTMYGINEVFFQDDTMNMKRDWFFSVCDEIIRRGLNESMSFKTSFRVNERLVDEELLQKAREAGFWIIFYGVESGNQRILDTIKKGTTLEEIKRAFRLTREAGIKTIAAFMVGNVGETPKTVKDSIQLAKEIRPDYLGFSIATPLPGTAFHAIAKEKGWIYSEDFSSFSQFEAVSRNEDMTMKEITALRNKADRETRDYLFEINQFPGIKNPVARRALRYIFRFKETLKSVPVLNRRLRAILRFLRKHKILKSYDV